MELQPGEIVDRYTVETRLGHGGMAVVYRVRHNTLETSHALKVLSVGSLRVRDRLIQEGKVQARMRHPNVVAVTDVLEVHGSPGLLMECIDGPPLDTWLFEQRPGIDEALGIFRGILEGVSFAHDLGIIHRDLKPANVMLAPTKRGLVPKVTDFGLAKVLLEEGGVERTRTGMPMGTPAYMSPEQIRDAKSVDLRADVFSLGCILYELVCGRRPFGGRDMLEIFNAVATGKCPPASSLVPDLPAEVEQAIHGCLMVDRDSRIGDCDVLSSVLSGERRWILAPSPGLPATFEMDEIPPSLASGGGQVSNQGAIPSAGSYPTSPSGAAAPGSGMQAQGGMAAGGVAPTMGLTADHMPPQPQPLPQDSGTWMPDDDAEPPADSGISMSPPSAPQSDWSSQQPAADSGQSMSPPSAPQSGWPPQQQQAPASQPGAQPSAPQSGWPPQQQQAPPSQPGAQPSAPQSGWPPQQQQAPPSQPGAQPSAPQSGWPPQQQPTPASQPGAQPSAPQQAWPSQQPPADPRAAMTLPQQAAVTEASPAEPVREAPPRRNLVPWAIGLLGSVALAAALAIVLTQNQDSEEPAPDPIATSEQAPEQAPDPEPVAGEPTERPPNGETSSTEATPAPTPELGAAAKTTEPQAPEPESPRAHAPVVTAAAAPRSPAHEAPAETPEEPAAEEPAAEKPSTAHVSFQGADAVWLEDDFRARYRAGREIPPGKYVPRQIAVGHRNWAV